MESKTFINLVQVEKMKILNSSLVNQLSKDEVIYIHLHCRAEDDFFSDMGDYSLPLSMADFKDIKSKINLKKLKVNELREDLISFIEEDGNIKNKQWFDMRVFTPKGFSSSSAFHLLCYNYITKNLISLFRNFNDKDIANLLTELSSNSNNKAEYNCIKSLATIEVLDSLKFTSDENTDKPFLDKNRSIKSEISKELIIKIEELQRRLMFSAYNNYILCCENVIEGIDKNYTLIKNQAKKTTLQLEERNQKIKTLKENIRDLNKQIKEREKTANITDISGLESSIKGIESILKNVQMLNQKTSEDVKYIRKDVVSKHYENQIDNYITRVSDLKKEIHVKNMEYKDLKKEFENYKANMEDNLVNYIRENGVSPKIHEVLKSFIIDKKEQDEYKMELFKSVDALCKDEEEPIIQPSVNIGYVSIENGVHYVNFMNGKMQPMIDLMDKVFLGEGQFVLVDSENRLIKTSNSRYDENTIASSNFKLGMIEDLSPLSVRCGNSTITDIKFNGNRNYYKLNQVIGLNNDNMVVKTFKTIRFNADEVIKSIKARNIDMYFVLDVFNGGLYKLRNIETGVEDIHTLDVKDSSISKHAIVFVKDSTVISATAQSKFYTASSFYKDRVVYGPITIDDNVVKLTKQSGEISIVKNVPDNYILENGEVIAVDEFNNFLYISNTDNVFIEKVVLKKPLKQILSSSDNKKAIEQKGEITIIGNLFYKNSYTMSFFKIGYKVNMLHGYDTSINKIIQVAKDSEAIIVNTSYCSHDNFWQIKDEVKDGSLSHLKYIFTQEDGANMLVHKFKEIENEIKSEVAITQ